MAHDMIFSLPVECKVLFSNHKNVYKETTEQRQRKLLVKLAFIKPFLKNDENIILVTTGHSPMTTFAQWLFGFLFIFLKRSLFVFTNKRIFMVPTRLNYAYRKSLAYMPYSDMQLICVKRRTLIVKCKLCGQMKKFVGISGRETKKIRAIMNTVKPDKQFAGKTQLTYLCPRCTEEIKEGVDACKNCRQMFKTAKKTRLFSFIAPGGGYFYLGHYVLGAFNALAEVALLVLIVIFAVKVSGDIRNIIQLLYLTGFVAVFVALKFTAAYHAGLFTSEHIPLD